MSTIPPGLRRLIGLIYLLLAALGAFFPISAQDTPTQSPPIAEESLTPEAVPAETTPTVSEVIIVETPPSPELTPEVTSEPVELVTPEATLEITAVPTPEVTSEATAEPVISPTSAANIPPAFNLAQTAYAVSPGVPLLLEVSVADDSGMVRLVEDVSATLGGLSLETQAPQETAAPYITRARVIYLPPADYLGADSFSLKAIDASGVTTDVTIQINIALLPEETPEVTAEATLEITPEVILPVGDPDLLAAGVFVVNSSGDAADANPADGVCQTATAGECTLRAAIETANARRGADTINFNIPGGGVHTIQPSINPPSITDSVVIDGYSQPGSAPATASTAATMQIVLDGTNAGYSIGLLVFADNSVIKGLVIHSFNSSGIFIGKDASGNRIEGNYIGTDVTGTVDLGNYSSGIHISSARDNLIGGTTPAARNLISGNRDGIVISGEDASDNRIEGNYIGTDASGSAGLGNQIGVYIESVSDNLIGGTTTGAGNLISGNSEQGIRISNIEASGNRIQGNYIGTDASGTVGLGNLYGVDIESAPDNLIGGAIPGARNVISGNNSSGIRIANSGASGNQIEGNYIGTDITGTLDLGNLSFGVIIFGVPNNVVGGTTAGARNLISGNNDTGIYIGSAASGNRVEGNYIGTDASGTSALGNGLGIRIYGSPNNTIGGTRVGARNLISGNGDGISIYGSGGNRIEGNYIGTDAGGTSALGNTNGVYIDNAPGNTIGGITSGARNLISGNDAEGIFIDGADAAGNRIQGNYIGTDVSGSARLGNHNGVWINDAPDNLVGGTTSGARNLVSGNNYGIRIRGSSASGNLIQGNYVGTDAAGKNALGNPFGGIIVEGAAAHITIGGTTAGARNLVSGNARGIDISDYAYDVVVAGNYIGTDAAGKAALGNDIGVWVDSATGITIGGSAAGAGNRIAYQGGDGVVVGGDSATVRILGNSISNNGGLGINMNDDGVTANDNGDVDTGPNGLQNFPVVTSVSGRTVLGYLYSESNRNYRLEFFASQTCDSSGNGEGERFLGRGVVTTDEMGNTPFNLTLGSSVPAGWFVTATATSLSGLTSEFSPCQIAPTVVPGRPTPTSPGNNAKITGNVVTLSWRAVPNATAYHLEVAYDDGFGSVWTTDNTDLTSASFYGLPRSEAYYWRVRALDGGGVGGAWSQTRKFEMSP